MILKLATATIIGVAIGVVACYQFIKWLYKDEI